VDFHEAVASCQVLLALIRRSWLGASRLHDHADFVRLELAAGCA
jgi:hypothetical protein